VAAGAVLVALAYLLGATAVAVSRALIDPVSRLTVQPALLWVFETDLRRDVTARSKGYRQRVKRLNERYRNAVSGALRSDSSEVKTEVLRRRERGRLVRTALVPAVLAAFSLAHGWWGAIGGLFAFFFVLLLYGYLEVTIYQEATLGDSSAG
jgi:hypothetical protein